MVVEEYDGIVALPSAQRVRGEVFEALHVAVDVGQLAEEALEVENVVLVVACDYGGLDVGVAHKVWIL